MGFPPTPQTGIASEADPRIGHYRIVRELGRGGQATVYLATDVRDDRRVALKVLDHRSGGDHRAFERFRREADIASRLDHPGICAVYDTGEDRGFRWIAMRYIEGQTIASQLASARSSGLTESDFVALSEGEGPPSDSNPTAPAECPSGPKTASEIERTLALFEDAARALHVAHEAGIIHRDIKPGNIMVTTEGNPVILDFGLAQEIDGDQPTLTVTGDVMGTPAYMSPEQIAAQRIRLDRRTDVYSLGVSLFECLTLRRPFEEPTRDRLYQAILTKPPSNPRELNPDLPLDVKVILETALEKDRDRRYLTAHDFAEDLKRARMHVQILAKPAGLLTRLKRWAQRNPTLATATAGLFVVLATGLTIALVLLDETRRERDATGRERDAKVVALQQADQQKTLAEQSAAKALHEQENTRRALALSRVALAEAAYREKDGLTMAVELEAVPRDLRDASWSYLQAHADTSRATFAGFHCGSAPHPTKPGIFAAATRHTIALVDAKTGATTFEFPVSANQSRSQYRRGLAFSPDGERLAAGSLIPAGIAVYDLRTGKALVEWDAPETDTVQFSSDGARLLQASSSGDVVALWDASSGRRIWSVPGMLAAVFDRTGDRIVAQQFDDRARLVLLDARDGSVIRQLGDAPNLIWAIALRPDGKVLATGDGAGFLRFLDAETGKVLFENRLQGQIIARLAFTPDGDRLVSVARHADQVLVTEWDADSGRFLHSLMGAAGKPEDLSIHPLSEDVIVTGPLTKTWNIARPKPRKVLRAMTSASFLGDADHVLCGNARGDVAVIDVGPASRGSLWTVKERPRAVVAVSLNRRVAAVATLDLAESEIVLYAVKDGAVEERQRLTVKYMLGFMRLSPDGSRLLSVKAEGATCELTETFASAGSDGAANPEATTIRVDDAGVTQLHDLAWLDNARVVSVATLHAPRGVDASREGLVVWNVDDMEQLAAKEHGSLLDCIVAAPDGHAVAEAGVDKIVRIRDGATLEVTHAFRAHDENVTALAWNPARPILATASTDLSVKLWNLETGLCVREIRFMPFAVRALGFSADGTRLLTVSAGVAALWDVD